MSPFDITVYTQNRCVQCNAVKNWLADKGFSFTEENGTDHIEFLEELDNYRSAPVTVIRVDGEIVNHFYGFDVNELGKLLVTT